MFRRKRKSFIGKIIYFIALITLIMCAYKLYNRYNINNFNEFTRMEYKPYTSEFTRDEKIKYSNSNTYKIYSKEQNDAMFCKNISVKPNTPYKVTCMVKTDNVKTIKEVSNAGAHISIADTVEKSKSITGTNDWQKLEFIFNSKNRTNIKLGFRLGAYDDNCTGTAWFSDFTIEQGAQSNDTNWNFACFVFENTNVEIDKNGVPTKVNLKMTINEINQMKQNISRFKASCEELSKNQMKVAYDFITIQEPIETLSYDNENGYYVAPENVRKLIQEYLNKKNYDHIFVCIKLGDNTHQNDIPVYDWIGLGGMDYLGIGFSNIRLSNSDKSYTYIYDSRVNTFPEEVFIHEFLHTLERNSEEYGYTIPRLHDYEQYGYKDEAKVGLKKWYSDYMTGNIKTTNGNIGLNNNIYKYKPNNEENFKFSYKLDEFKEPQNIIKEIIQIIHKAINNISEVTIKKEGNTI